MVVLTLDCSFLEKYLPVVNQSPIEAYTKSSFPKCKRLHVGFYRRLHTGFYSRSDRQGRFLQTTV